MIAFRSARKEDITKEIPVPPQGANPCHSRKILGARNKPPPTKVTAHVRVALISSALDLGARRLSQQDRAVLQARLAFNAPINLGAYRHS